MTPEQAYEEVVRLAREHALIYKAVGGVVVVVHPATQKKEGIYEKIQRMHCYSAPVDTKKKREEKVDEENV